MKKLSALLLVFTSTFTTFSFGQGGNPGHLRSPIEFLGWDGTGPAGDLQIRNDFVGQRINIFTNGTRRMTIMDGGTTAADGFVGFSNAPGFTPVQRVDVAGDINLRTNIFMRTANNDGYRINNQTVLAVKNSNDLFVGFGAGASWVSTGVHENTFVGNNSGFSNTTGARNAFFGFNSGRNNVTGTDNTFLGFRAGAANTSSNNTFVGTLSGLTNTTGQFNTFIGNLSGGSNTSGRFNTYLGCYTVQGGTPSTADNNTHIGFEAGQFTTTGDRNVLTGANAGHDITIGSQNVITGMDAGFSIIDGGNNVFIGWESAIQNTTGDRNAFLGSRTGRNQLGDYCTFIGYEAGYDNTTNTYTLFNAAGIGNGAIPTADNKMILGNNNVWVGIGLTNDPTPNFGPQNSLEINARVLGTGAVIADASGLRFRQLTSASPTVANPGTGILALSSTGDVIYVPAPTGGTGTVTGAHNGTSLSNITANFVAFGQDFSEPGNPGRLQNNREVPMNNFNISFTDAAPTPGGGKITIGMPLGFNAKLGINNTAEISAIQVQNNTSLLSQYGAYIIGSGTSQTSTGIYTVSNCTGDNNYGIWAVGQNAINYNYGGFFLGNGTGTNNFGIYANAAGGTNNYAGWFDGDVNVNGALTVFGTPVLTSDAMFKTNIDSIENAIGIIAQLQPKKFNFDTTNIYGISFPSQKQYGFVAQEVEPILPELVVTSHKPEVRDSAGAIINSSIDYKSLNYNAFIAILVKGMQEQNKTIDSLSQILSEVITTVNSCCNSNHSMQLNNNSTNSIASQDVNLKDEQSIVLETNVPNPFAEQTAINYFLPDNVKKAQMLFYNAQGKLIQSVELTQKGKGSLNVFAQDLSNGIYTYTLVADGKVFETKKMIKQ